MSVERCEQHNQPYDTDKVECCPHCEQEKIEALSTRTPPDDGDPAFPWGEHGTHLGGATMRDCFAMAALQSPNCPDFPLHEDAAKWAYERADAMLATRKNA